MPDFFFLIGFLLFVEGLVHLLLLCFCKRLFDILLRTFLSSELFLLKR